MIEVNGSNFDELVSTSDKPLILHFTALWCGPCRMMRPALSELETEYPGVIFCEVDVDLEPEIAEKWGILSLPTFLLLINGKLERKLIGAMPKKRFVSGLSPWLK